MTNSINEKHLELLQGVINRMAGNSFLLKGWSVTLVAALLALAAGKANPLLVSVALLPVLAFWGLDGYFLAQERLFRKLYERVIAGDSTLDTFSMRTDPLTMAFWWATTWSVTLRYFHGAVLLVVVLFLGLNVISGTL
jgi:hypothetical protein